MKKTTIEKKKYKGLVISDIHVGAFDVSRQLQEWDNIFIRFIKESKDPIDFIVITGDFFDHKLYLNEKESAIAYYMLSALIELTDQWNTKIRIVYGTESHEANQYQILNVIGMVTECDRLQVMKTVSEEFLFPDMKVLYIPEEYIYDKKEYYQEYFLKDSEYDYIFGHGVVQEVFGERVVQLLNKNKEKRKKPPIFTSAELIKICKGQIFFGHYHIRSIIGDKVFSVGSFSRWKFGEEEEKGFYELTCNPSKHQYDYTFHENTLAQRYKTIGFGYQSKIFTDTKTMEEEFNKIDQFIRKDMVDHIRFELNIPENVEAPEGVIQYVKEKFKQKDNVKVNIVNGYAAAKKEQKKEVIRQEATKYDFLFDQIPIHEKIAQFISIEYHKEIGKDTVKEYLKEE